MITAGAIVAGDFVLTLFKWLQNQNEYNRRWKLGKFHVGIGGSKNEVLGTLSYRF